MIFKKLFDIHNLTYSNNDAIFIRKFHLESGFLMLGKYDPSLTPLRVGNTFKSEKITVNTHTLMGIAIPTSDTA